MIILICAALTVIIETPWMYLWGIRKRDGILLVVCVNVASNLILNLVLALGFAGREVGAYIYLFEALVVAAEYGVYALALRSSWKLFLTTFSANCLSYGLGLIIL